MTVHKIATLTLVMATMLGLAACGDSGDRGDRDRGEWRDPGPMRSETRDVGSFDSISIEGGARVEITVGQPESLVIEAPEKILERIESDVHGDTLRIKAKSKRWLFAKGRQGLKLKIGVPQLHSLRLEGGNDVLLTGYDGGESRIKVAGAANIEADGRLEQLTVHLAGAGNADLSRLIADDAKVTVDGVGSVVVHPRDTLDATMNGVGAILYTGSPRKVSTRMNGLGTIAQQDEAHDGQGHDERGRDRRHRDDGREEHRDRDEAPADVDPDTLQPEYEEPARKPAGEPAKIKIQDSTEVI